MYILSTYCQLVMHFIAHINSVQVSWRHLSHTRTAFRIKSHFTKYWSHLYLTANFKKILKISIKRSILILKKKLRTRITEDHVAIYTCRKIFQDPAFWMPIKVQQPKFPFLLINLCCLLWICSLFKMPFFFISLLFDKTGNCAVQENIKIYFKLG